MLFRMKRGENLLTPNTVFIILNLIFFVILLLFINRQASSAAIYEETYAKQIALLIDSAKPGTNITLDISQLYEMAWKDKYNGLPVLINPLEKSVTVALSNGKGYSFKYFNGAKIDSKLKPEEKTLFLEVK